MEIEKFRAHRWKSKLVDLGDNIRSILGEHFENFRSFRLISSWALGWVLGKF